MYKNIFSTKNNIHNFMILTNFYIWTENDYGNVYNFFLIFFGDNSFKINTSI